MIEDKKYTIRDKKRFLNQFYWLSKESESLEEKIKTLTMKMQGLKGTTYSDMPKVSTGKDINDLLHEKMKYQSQLAQKMIKIDKTKEEIEFSIDTLEDSKLRIILTYKYLENKTYKEISNILDKSERHIRRLHDKAIVKIIIIRKDEA